MTSDGESGVFTLTRLYQEAFRDYRAVALWNVAQHAWPLPSDALAVARCLRIHGDLAARRLAEAIEREAAHVANRPPA